MTMQAPSEPETIVQGASLSTAMAAAAAAFTVTGRARPRLGRQLRALKGALAPLASRSDADGLAPASRWFYDNARMLEEACLQAAEETKRLRPLPAYGRTPRALRLCREACAALEARMDAASLEAAAAAWQQTQPLEEEELAVLPLFARLALLEILSSLAVECARAEADRRAAESEAGLPAASRSDAYLERRCALLQEAQDTQGMEELDSFLQDRRDSAQQLVQREQRRQMRQCLWTAGAVRSLHAFAALRWKEAHERLSLLHALLGEDPANVYKDMDFATRCLYRARCAKLSRQFRQPPESVARAALALCAQAEEGLARHVGYYLLDEGQPRLWEALGRAPLRLRAGLALSRRASKIYVAAITAGSLGAGAALYFAGVRSWLTAPALLAAGEGFRQLAGLVLNRLSPPRMLPRMKPDCLGEGGVLVAVPTLLTGREQALAMVRHLSVLRLANPEKQLSYLLLADFVDGPASEEPRDAEITAAALEAVRALNEVWGGGFYYLHRARQWDAREKRFMGRERKRGALCALNEALLCGRFPDPLAAQSVDPAALAGRFPIVVTLDADTQLPPGAALKLAGVLRHPLNRRIAVLQPRMEQSAASIRTRIARIFGGQGGFDPYCAAFADVYQNVCGEGSFAGKGAYDVAEFARATRGKIRPDSVLSHDLLEGALAGSALAGDIALFDSEPGTLQGWLRRLHRWTRGDWQLLPWLFPRIQGEEEKFSNPLSLLSRFKIMDNLRRSLVPAAGCLLLIGGAACGQPVAFAAGLLLAHTRELLHPTRQGLRAAFFSLAVMPLKAVCLLDAAVRTLWRMGVSHKHLLEWTTSAQAEQQRGARLLPLWPNGAMTAGLLFACTYSPGFFVLGIPLSLLWLLAPVLERYLNAPETSRQPLSPRQRDFLQDVAARTFRFFERTVGEGTNYLPPDNLQVDPPKGAAPRTSPTNIGMYLLSCVCAHELSLLSADDAAIRIERTVGTMERMEKWRGHLLNWYDIRTLEPLPCRYVSTVDSGNLCACLLLCAQALRAWLAELDVAHRDLPERLDALGAAMDFRSLYDESVDLFYIGMDLENLSPGEAHYDLLASEARLTSFLAIMRREVPARHWSRLNRAMTKARAGAALLSWSGTLFEYLLPALFLQSPRATLLYESAKSAALTQLTAFPGGPWGVSESGYYAFDPELSYQYHAFGLPCLALRTQPLSRVIAPYASALALAVVPGKAVENLQHMASMGFLAPLGFYEAVDYGVERLPEGCEYRIVKSHMAHHQGMVMAAVCNALCGGVLTRYFRRLPQVEAYALLLEERRPSRAMLRRASRIHREPPQRRETGTAQRKPRRDALPAQVQVMGGGGTTFVCDARGSGYLAARGMLLTCWEADPLFFGGPQVYLRAGGKTLSINRCAEVLFRRGRAVYTLEMENLRAELTCFVSPLDGAAIQLVRLRAADGATMQADVASFLDLCLAGEAEFESHPAFQRLLIQTQALGENMLAARRRPRRAGEEPVLACHLAFSDGPCRFYRETDRAAFLGRGGGLDAPQALARPAVQGRTGDVLGACFSLRAQLELGEGQARLLWFVTAAVDGEEQVHSLCERYAAADVALQALALSETQASVAARYLGLDEAGELAAQRAAAYLLTPSPQNSAPPATKEALWQFSISGDLPVMAVSVQEMAHLPLAREAVRMHAYLRQLGVRFDLALINGQAQGYFQPLREALQALLASGPSRDAIGKPGGVTLLSESAYPKEALAALKALAALRLDGRKGSLGAQLAGARTAVPALKNGGCKEQALRPEAGTPALNNGYGGFLRDGSYLCYRMPPVPWCNVLVGAGLGAVMTDRGPGFVYAGNSRLGRLTAHPSDPVLDSTAEGLFLRDEESGAYASLTEDALALYAPGRMALRCDALGLHTSVEYFVDSELPVRCALITLENTGEAQRSVSVTSCVRFLLGSHRRDAMQARCRVEKGVCIAASPALEREAYLTCAGACEASVNAAAFYGAFPAGTPRAMAAPHLQEGDACGPFGAVRAFVALRPGESADVCVLLGVGDWEKAREAFFAGAARLRLNRVKKRWEERVSRLRALTPDTAISVLLGTWLPYQLLASRVEAKAGFQQAGGATGFRDQLQDMLALRYTEPETVRAHLLRAAAHQFEAGDVQHWWHEPALGVRTRITDDRLFLPFAAAAYARAAGDTGVFDELVPYLQDAPIPAGREDFYANIPPGPVAGTLREHCLRAIDSVRMGEHGLALMGAGDWNDGMNRVGAGGKGESVWLTFFLAQTLRVFAPYAGAEGARLLAERERLLRAAEESAWNGQWYLRAWFDDGRPLGGPDAPECQMDLLPQAWAVLAGAPHAQTALRAALNRLVDREHGIVRLLDPPFDGQSDPGYIRAYPPGVRENGGQYTHAAAWLVMACAQAGLTQEAWEIFTMLLPTSHTRTSRATLHYQGEPFVVAADVSSGENVGRAGWTWYTGSAGMLLRAGVEWLMGFEKEGDKIRLRPTAPKDWPGFTLEYRCEGTLYRLRAARGERDDGWIRLQGGAGVKEAVFALR